MACAERPSCRMTKLATPRDALSVFLLQICGYTSHSRAAEPELRNLVCLILAQIRQTSSLKSGKPGSADGRLLAPT